MTTTEKPTDKAIGDAQSDKRAGAGKNSLPSIGVLAAEGLAALRRYKGLAIVLYGVQFVVALMLTWAISRMLAAAFADQPMFDLAVDGDVAALIFLITDEPFVFTSILYAIVATALGYWLLSWFLIGGLNAVLVERPDTRGEVLKQFGQGGVRTYFAYARLTLLSLIPYAVISGVLMYGMSSAADDLRYGLTFGDVFFALMPRLLPGLLLLLLHMTAIDYARVELSRTIGLASRHALWRAYRTIGSDWRPVVHILGYVGFFAAISLLYVLITNGAAMPGAAGAIGLFIIRQCLSAIRFAGKLVCAGGQVVYADARNHDRQPKKRLPVVQ